MTKPKPCPFCGETPFVYDFQNGWHIQCANDDCLVKPDLFRMRHRQDDALCDWNTRRSEGGADD